MALKVLFIGGSGVISSACSALAAERGMDLYLFNRGQSGSLRPIPKQATVLTGDIHSPEDMRRVLANHQFDVVVDWIAFLPRDVRRDIETFKDKVGQYIFISSASAYQKPLEKLPIPGRALHRRRQRVELRLAWFFSYWSASMCFCHCIPQFQLCGNPGRRLPFGSYARGSAPWRIRRSSAGRCRG